MKKLTNLFSLVLCVLTLFAAVPVMSVQGAVAETPQEIFENSTDTFFFDETGALGSGQIETMNRYTRDTYKSSGCNIGVYIGKETRYPDDTRDLCATGIASLMAEKEGESRAFLYIDMSGAEKPVDFFYIINSNDETLAASSYSIVGTPSDYIEELLYYVRQQVDSNASDGPVSQIITGTTCACNHIVTNHTVFVPEKAEPEQYSNVEQFILGENGEESSSVSSEDQVYKEGCVYFNDEANLFSSSERKQIIRILAETSDAIAFNLALYVGGKSRSDSRIENLVQVGAANTFDFNTYNGTVYLYIDFDGYTNAYDYMFSANDAFLYYTNGDDGTEDRVIKMLHAMEAYFPPGGGTVVNSEVIKGIQEYCDQLKKYKSEGLVSGIYYTDAKTGEYVYASNGKIVRSNFKPYKYWYWGLLIGLAVGGVVAAIVSGSVKKRYKFKSSTSASVYTSREKTVMRVVEDTFLGSTISKVKIETSSGGHGGHGGGGGGHVGGGGGGSHR